MSRVVLPVVTRKVDCQSQQKIRRTAAQSKSNCFLLFDVTHARGDCKDLTLVVKPRLKRGFDTDISCEVDMKTLQDSATVPRNMGETERPGDTFSEVRDTNTKNHGRYGGRSLSGRFTHADSLDR